MRVNWILVAYSMVGLTYVSMVIAALRWVEL